MKSQFTGTFPEMPGSDQHGFHEHQQIELDNRVECMGKDP